MRLPRLLSASIVAMGLLAPAVGSTGSPPLVITTLSTNPDRVSGGDVVVRIDVPVGVALDKVQMSLNSADVTGAFQPAGTGHALVGLVTGLKDGDNVLKVAAKDANPSLNGRLDLRNFPSYGPIFAGPHQIPWICETDDVGPRPRARRALHRAHALRLVLPDHRRHVPAVGHIDPSLPRRPRADDDDRRPHRQLHRARGIGDDRSVHLPHRDHRRPDGARSPIRGHPAGRSPGPAGTASSASRSEAAVAPRTAPGATP